jgi:hypothetical protein
MAQVNSEHSIAAPAICELSLRLQLRKSGLRLERRGFGYRLLAGNQVLLDRGPDGFGLSLEDVATFTNRALVR